MVASNVEIIQKIKNKSWFSREKRKDFKVH